ncbi:hypothetical protein [Nocardioides sp. HB32]
MQTAARVVVAVGRYGSSAALDHAVAEAGRRRAELSMVQARDVRTMSEAAGAADLVVAGRFPELAAHLGAPLVCVPDDWRPRLGPRTVVAGIGDPAACPELLAVAAATARLWHARLVVVTTHRRHFVDALVEASRHADLVVLGRHARVGPVARGVARGAACPVLLTASREQPLAVPVASGLSTIA